MGNTIEIRIRTIIWAATSAALAVVATLIVTSASSADAAPGDEDSTYVPTAGCRAFDLRPPPNQVGPRPAPLAAGEVYTQQITGNVGECTGPLAIPADAVAVAMNVTAVGPTAQTNLRLFPANLTDVPTLSNLNVSAGQAPFPNKVDVALSPSGAIKIFNQNGSVSVLGDVVGYYTKSSLQELDADISDLGTRVSALEALTSANSSEIAAVGSALPFANIGYLASGATLTTTPETYATVEITAPVDGQVTVNWSAFTRNSSVGSENACYPDLDTAAPVQVAPSDPGVGFWETATIGNGDEGSFSGTHTFDIAAGETRTYALWCEEYSGTGSVAGRTITAIFTPAP